MYEDPSAPDEEPSSAQPDPDLEQAVLAQLELERNQQSSWGNAILILVVSVMFFAGARDGGGWDSLWIVIPVLFFHELGHFVTMRFFGYRNLKMFFIPFFGAAVSGRHYNVQGWKKALVALMGPLPGIVLGTGLGIAGLMLREPINARPPDIAASFGLLVLHGGAFVTAVVMAIMLAVGQRMMAEEMNGDVVIVRPSDDRVAAVR